MSAAKLCRYHEELLTRHRLISPHQSTWLRSDLFLSALLALSAWNLLLMVTESMTFRLVALTKSNVSVFPSLT